MRMRMRMRMLPRLVCARRVGWGAAATCIVVVTAAWLAGSAGLLRGQPAGAGRGGKPLRIATVNIKQVSSTCQRYLDLQAAFDKQREAKLVAVRNLGDKLQRAEQDLQVLVKGSAARREQQAKVLRMKVEARVLSELSLEELRVQHLEYTARIYEGILKETERYARAHGIEVVLRTGETDTKATTLDELYRRMDLRGVLYAAPALDITEAIRREVDRAYQAEKRGGRD